MKLPSRDFESRASAIPPLRQVTKCILTQIIFFYKHFCKKNHNFKQKLKFWSFLTLNYFFDNIKFTLKIILNFIIFNIFLFCKHRRISKKTFGRIICRQTQNSNYSTQMSKVSKQEH